MMSAQSLAEGPERHGRRSKLVGIWIVTAVLVVGGRWLIEPTDAPIRTATLQELKIDVESVPVSVVVVRVDKADAESDTTIDAGASVTAESATTQPTESRLATAVANRVESINLLPGQPQVAYAILDGVHLLARGAVPDEAARLRFLEKLQNIGGIDVIDNLVVSSAATAPPERPSMYVPDAATFEPDSTALVPAARLVIETVAGIVERNGPTRLVIRGHSDGQGPDHYNLRLSVERVAAVFNYLAERGVDPAQMQLDPRGELEPLQDNATVIGRVANRRVEIYLLPG